MQTLEPLLIPVDETCRLLGVGRSLLYQMSSDGRLGPKPIKAFGNKTLFNLQELRDWINEGNFLSREQWLRLRGAVNG